MASSYHSARMAAPAADGHALERLTEPATPAETSDVHPSVRSSLALPWLAALASFGGSANAQAAADASAEAPAAIRAGGHRVGGAFSASYDTDPTGSSLTWNLSLSGQRFVRDGLAAGLTGSLSSTSADAGTFYAFGPVASVYLPIGATSATFVSQGFEWNVATNDLYFDWLDSTTRLGWEFFLNPHVGAGPALLWTHSFGRDTARLSVRPSNRYAFTLGLSIYL